MTKDEIIEMARQAGFEEHQAKFDTRCTHPVKDLEDIAINITWNENSMRDFGKDELNFARAILRKAQEQGEEQMKTPEDEEFERIEAESGWRKRQVQAVIEDDDDIQDYKKPWVGLTDEEIQECLKGLPTQTIDIYARRIEDKLRKKNT